jgi:hypothetical protein
MGIIKDIYKNIWKSKVPLRVKVFLWQLYNLKVQAGAILKMKGWKGSDICSLCQKLETIDHIFFHCTLPYFAWSCLRHVFGWNNIPSPVEEVFCFWVEALSVSLISACRHGLGPMGYGIIETRWCSRESSRAALL